MTQPGDAVAKKPGVGFVIILPVNAKRSCCFLPVRQDLEHCAL